MQISQSDGAVEISNSSDPYKAYCDYLREKEVEYDWKGEPIYIWDVDDSKEAEQLKIDWYYSTMPDEFKDEILDKCIVGYKKTSDRMIEDLDLEIKEALDNYYNLQWEVW